MSPLFAPTCVDAKRFVQNVLPALWIMYLLVRGFSRDTYLFQAPDGFDLGEKLDYKLFSGESGRGGVGGLKRVPGGGRGP